MQFQKEEMEAQKEQVMKWTDFLISIYSQPARENESAQLTRERESFINSLRPKKIGGGSQPEKEFKWNIPQEEIDKAQALALEEGGV